MEAVTALGPDILDYASACSAGPGLVGGKAYNLARASRWGFPAPEGWVVPAGNYKALLNRPSISDLMAEAAAIDAANAGSPESADLLRRLQAALCDTPLSAEEKDAVGAALAAKGLDTARLAVRSSATGEDGEDYSFAGIHDSELNVVGAEAVALAIRRCQASLWSPHAVAYRRRFGISDETVACAVLICRMIGKDNAEPVAAGVAFTADPTSGDRDTYVIEATPGLADKLVSGQVTPFTYKVHVGLSNVRADVGGGVLTPKQCVELARLLQRVHWSFGAGDQPQDVEWAFDGDQFWIVQVRPVTSIPHPNFPELANQPVIWSNANLREVLPSVLTIFSWSLLKTGIRASLFDPHKAAGYRPTPGLELMRRFDGRAYFEVSAMQWAGYDAFGVLPSELNRELGGVTPEIAVPAGDPLKGPGAGPRMWRGLKMMRIAMRLKRILEPRTEAMRALAVRVRETDLSALQLGELAALWSLCERELLQFPFMYANAAANLYITMARKAGERTTPREKLDQLISGSLSGLGGVVSAEHGYALQQLSTYMPGSKQAEEAWARFVAEYGHRAFDELELANPRWSEDLPRLREISQSLAGAVHSRDTARQVNDKAKQLLAATPLSTRVVLRWALKRAAYAYAQREAAKSAVVAVLGCFRSFALEIGRRLVQTGRLRAVEDVFQLSAPDILAYLEGRWDGEGAHGLAADRRVEREAMLAEPDPPPVILEGADALSAPAPVANSARRAAGEWSGIAAAVGRAEGPARLVAEPSRAEHLHHGDILVAKTTDPGWTPLFLRAGGLIVEHGGYLSHGAIVAREFGIPAVVNVPGIRDVLKDGDAVEVSGDAGVIRLLREARPQKPAALAS